MIKTLVKSKIRIFIQQQLAVALIVVFGLAGALSIIMINKTNSEEQSLISITNQNSRINRQATNPMSLRVGMIRMLVDQSINIKIEQLSEKVGAIVSDYGQVVDVVVTPEYSFTSSNRSNYPQYALSIDCDNEYTNCEVTEGGGIYSELLATEINDRYKNIAIDNQLYIYFGTVIEKFDAIDIPEITSEYVYYNDLLIIEPDGTISIKRKTSADWNSTCSYLSDCWYAIRAEALNTVRSYTIYNRQDEPVVTFPVICGERFYQAMINQAISIGLSDLDILISPEREGDVHYETITQAIQDGTWDEDMPDWDWGIEEGFIDVYIGSGLLRSDGYLAVVEGGDGEAGLINLVNPPAPVTEFELTENYMYGLVQYCEDGTIEGQCTDSVPIGCVNRELQDACQKCGCPQGNRCLPNGSCHPDTGSQAEYDLAYDLNEVQE
ncbi:hypothetical protein KKG41_03245 [Patescibacteria group bacterium]|nr:hypothetical protein [Patescibacteria group bacterium]MBU1890611.1 hypothetical protein [Patescibacteria group bacterium]